MWARAHLREPNLIPRHKELHPKNTLPPQTIRDLQCDVLGAFQGPLRHGLRLPALDIVAVHLAMADRFAKMCRNLAVCATCTHRQERDLIFKIDEPLNNDARTVDPTPLPSNIPSRRDILRPAQYRLALARGGHHRLDQTGKTNFLGRKFKLLDGIRELIGRGRQSQLLSRQPADSLAIHRQLRGPRSWGHAHLTCRLKFNQQLGRDRFNFRDNNVGALLCDYLPKRFFVCHGDNMRPVRDLLPGCLGITVHRNDFNPKAL